MTRPWGCPRCGHKVGLVQDTGSDTEGYKVRLRACTECGELWATEETPIAVEAFYARNNARRVREHRYYRDDRRTCRWCGGTYQAGSYRDHCQRQRHIAALKPLNRNRGRARKYQRHWLRQQREDAA